MVPSIDQYSDKITFVSIPISGPYPVTSHYINIAATSQDKVLMDGSVLSLTWNTIYNDNSIIGYGAQVQITDLNSHYISIQTKYIGIWIWWCYWLLLQCWSELNATYW